MTKEKVMMSQLVKEDEEKAEDMVPASGSLRYGPC